MLSLSNITWQLSGNILAAVGKPLFTTALVGDESGEVLQIQAGWAGGQPQVASRGSYFGSMKAIELLHSVAFPNAKLDQVVLGPVHGYPYSSGYRGGVRFPVETQTGKIFYITAASGDTEEVDLMIALLMNWAMRLEIKLHHVGFRHESYHSMMAAIAADAQRLRVIPTYHDGGDHDRWYLWSSQPGPNGGYWIEHQYYPEGCQKPGIHIDVQTHYAQSFLVYMGYFLKTPEVMWDYNPAKDPMGKVAVTDRNGVEFAIMAREQWWQIPEHCE